MVCSSGPLRLHYLDSPVVTYTDDFPSRFLRARKFDVPKAKEMLKSAEQWRKDFGVDEIVKYVWLLPSGLLILTYLVIGTLISRKRKR